MAICNAAFSAYTALVRNTSRLTRKSLKFRRPFNGLLGATIENPNGGKVCPIHTQQTNVLVSISINKVSSVDQTNSYHQNVAFMSAHFSPQTFILPFYSIKLLQFSSTQRVDQHSKKLFLAAQLISCHCHHTHSRHISLSPYKGISCAPFAIIELFNNNV